jgi:3-aminobutyryl-CoA ammonia-lyase
VGQLTEPTYESLIRVRMSSADAHYGGGLVDGARIMQLFGDAATELLIRHDGDEGLFVAYSRVEFLAPVYAGDYIEARARITRVGNTSRGMSFEAVKVIEATQGGVAGVAPSAASPLTTPRVVARAEGTCVVPAARMRAKGEREG